MKVSSLLLLASLVAGAASAAPLVRRDIPYAGTPDPKQTLDVYAPEGGSKRPVIVWVHGGGWAGGDKSEDIDLKASAFLNRGWVLVSVNYRLLFRPQDHPGVDRPAFGVADIEGDLAKAVAWVHGHAAEFGGDPDFLFLMGHSAGAQLVALLCTDEKYLGREGLPLSLIKGCVPLDGDTYYPELQIDSSTPRMAAGYRRKFPDAAAQHDLAAVNHVAAGKGIPPFLLVHVADFPQTGTKIQAEILAQVMRKKGLEAKTFAAAGKTHLTVNSDLGRPGDPATQAIEDFFDAQIFLADYATWSRSVKLGRP